ncbi:hypothetical protein RRG08_011927 [Elysia crispata]|uniref:Uncharacterized protein n=1 Tax=Elysia crispata TaxID=231223 RepID=A0AAE0XVN5_9GAST|nr:hypothetical protein RRG08_011927 [Elysia crispata]
MAVWDLEGLERFSVVADDVRDMDLRGRWSHGRPKCEITDSRKILSHRSGVACCLAPSVLSGTVHEIRLQLMLFCYRCIRRRLGRENLRSRRGAVIVLCILLLYSTKITAKKRSIEVQKNVDSEKDILVIGDLPSHFSASPGYLSAALPLPSGLFISGSPVPRSVMNQCWSYCPRLADVRAGSCETLDIGYNNRTLINNPPRSLHNYTDLSDALTIFVPSRPGRPDNWTTRFSASRH